MIKYQISILMTCIAFSQYYIKTDLYTNNIEKKTSI